MLNVYDQLFPPLQSLVDRLLTDTADEGWEVKRAYLASVYTALDRGRDTQPGLDPEASLSAIIAAVIDRAGAPEIGDPLQAGIYLASADPAHRDAGAAWFDRHPDDYDRIRRDLTGGGRLN
jgi:hypothetical protein